MSGSWVYGIVLVVYLIFFLWIGRVGARQSTSLQDFTISGWRLGLLAVVGTFLGAEVSAATIVGVPGLMYTKGISAAFAILGGYVLVHLFYALMAYKIRRPETPAATMPEYLRLRFEPYAKPSILQVIGALSMVFGYFLYVQIQTASLGMVLSTITGLPYQIAALIFIVFLVYNVLGGLWSVALTNILNAAIIFVGTIIAGIVILHAAGGWDSMWTALAQINTPPIEGQSPTPPGMLVSPLGGFTVGGIVGLYIASVSAAFAPHWPTTLMAARNCKVGILNALYLTLLVLGVYTGTVFLGAGGRVLIPTLPQGVTTDWLLPHLATQFMHPLLGGLLLATIFAACVSTANAMLLWFSTAFMYDIVRNISPSKLPDEMVMRWSKIIVVIVGIVAVLFSLRPPAFVALLAAYCFGLWGSTYIMPVLFGLFSKRASRVGAYLSVICGPLTYLIADILIKRGVISAQFPAIGYGLLVALIGMLIGYFFEPVPKAGWEPYWEATVSAETQEVIMKAKRERE